MRPRDLILIMVALAGIAFGVAWPRTFLLISPHVVYGMMAVLYMSFLRLDFKSLVRITPGGAFEVLFWTLVKLFIIPIAAWAVAMLTVPRMALPVLLLSAAPVGVVAPFFADVLGANIHRVLQMVVASSVLAPLVIPFLVQVLMGAEVKMPYGVLMRSLMFILFIPMGLAFVTRLLAPKLVSVLGKVQYPLNLALFFTINLGVFAKYANFLLNQGDKVLLTVTMAFVLALAYVLGGFYLARFSRHLEGLTGAVGMTYINNVMIVVFSADFFGPESPLLSALYMIPVFIMLVPLRRLSGRRGRP